MAIDNQNLDSDREVNAEGEQPSELEGDSNDPETGEKVEGLAARADRLLANWQRAQADFSNFRKQVEQEKEVFAHMANASLLMGILPVLDDLERALQTVAPQMKSLTWVDGIWLIHQKLLAVMNGYGLEAISTDSGKFDPRLHESVAEEEGPEGEIVSVVQQGYMVRGRLIRPSLVTVGRSSVPQPDPQTTDSGETDENQELPTP